MRNGVVKVQKQEVLVHDPLRHPRKTKVRKLLWRDRYLYLLLIPAILYFIIFKFAPMYGVQIAFKDYKINLGIGGSEWVGTAISMFCTICTAYSLSKKRLYGRTVFLGVITFTMIVNAGLIPNFLLVKDLGLMNTYWAIWLPSAISTWNMLVMKTFFSALPDSLEESALIDGANDLRILWSVILPLSLPLLATFTLYYAVERWNEWYLAMLYVKSVQKWPLQNVLRTIINDVNMMATQNIPGQAKPDIQGDSIKMSSIIVAMAPIMCLYPFLQRYFLSGLTLGAVKE